MLNPDYGMLNTLLRWIFRFLISLRYRITVIGLDRLAPKDERGILFLPNHPALIDPFILLCILTAKYSVRPLAGRGQLERPMLRWLSGRVGVRKIPDANERDLSARHRVASVLRETARALDCGETIVFYPAGRVYRKNREDIGNNGGAAFLLRACPTVRVVLVRTTGLWGSAFGHANGRAPSIGYALKHGSLGLLRSGLLFAPRRRVTIEFTESENVPRQASHKEINRFLEAHYNAVILPNTYVPYSIWERGKARTLPEPDSTDETSATENGPVSFEE